MDDFLPIQLWYEIRFISPISFQIWHASVHSTGKCAMLYKPQVSPSTTTEIILNVDTVEPNNTLLYLARKKVNFLSHEQ